MIGLCKRAGALIEGSDAVWDATMQGRVHLLLIAEDISPRSLKRMQEAADRSNTTLTVIPTTIHELGERLGRKVGILGIGDENFSHGIKEILAATT